MGSNQITPEEGKNLPVKKIPCTEISEEEIVQLQNQEKETITDESKSLLKQVREWVVHEGKSIGALHDCELSFFLEQKIDGKTILYKLQAGKCSNKIRLNMNKDHMEATYEKCTLSVQFWRSVTYLWEKATFQNIQTIFSVIINVPDMKTIKTFFSKVQQYFGGF